MGSQRNGSTTFPPENYGEWHIDRARDGSVLSYWACFMPEHEYHAKRVAATLHKEGILKKNSLSETDDRRYFHPQQVESNFGDRALIVRVACDEDDLSKFEQSPIFASIARTNTEYLARQQQLLGEQSPLFADTALDKAHPKIAERVRAKREEKGQHPRGR